MKSVLVTGAGSGFGKGACLELANRGHRVIATTETVEQCEKLRKETPQLQVEKLDITTDDISKVSEWEIEVLVNNAGTGQSGPLAAIPIEKINQTFSVNVFGTLALTQKVLEQMLPRQSGRILIMSSIGGLVTVPGFGAYTMTKHALEALGRTLSAELNGTGIDVGIINPGPYNTGFNDRMAASMWDWFNDASLLSENTDMFKAVCGEITGNQIPDTADVEQLIANLVEADTIDQQNIIPPDILDNFGA
ncbi:hypothetical protein AB833_06500 [Chromatiales bacterium (ex Bugula neritina AB1)]|nr:hypothetical protein AB833_06500 [Chromatiales bacterium (ex Bugula neritina AB1)]